MLQSILGNRRITNILNKYADDAILSSSTLSLMAQNQMNAMNGEAKNDASTSATTNGISSAKDETGKEKEEMSEADKVTFDLNLGEVNVVVDSASSSSVSPSSPSSSASSSPPSQPSPNPQPAHAQISA